MDGTSKTRILVVDDDAGMLRAVARILGSKHHVDCVGSGPEALAELDGFDPELAVIDIRMPEMNGFTLMRELQGRWPDIDVILMTGNAEEPDSNLVRAISEGAFYFIQKPFDRRVLLALVSRCSELRQLRREKQSYTQQLVEELEEARHFQMSLLPPPQSELLGLSISARYVSCNSLAGDFYDYVRVDDDSVAFLVADVVGHGASAAMLTSIVKSAFRAAQADGYEPLRVIDRVKDAMRVFDPGRFVTLVCARLNTRTGELQFVNAGHPSPIMRRSNNQPLLLESTGPLVSSALWDFPSEQQTVRLERDDALLMYTDGIVEVTSPSGLFGTDRLVALMTRNGIKGPELLEIILADVAEFSGARPNTDDMTLLMLEFAAE